MLPGQCLYQTMWIKPQRPRSRLTTYPVPAVYINDCGPSLATSPFRSHMKTSRLPTVQRGHGRHHLVQPVAPTVNANPTASTSFGTINMVCAAGGTTCGSQSLGGLTLSIAFAQQCQFGHHCPGHLLGQPGPDKVPDNGYASRDIAGFGRRGRDQHLGNGDGQRRGSRTLQGRPFGVSTLGRSARTAGQIIHPPAAGFHRRRFVSGRATYSFLAEPR